MKGNTCSESRVTPWTYVLDWSSEYGDLEPPICVVYAPDLAIAREKAVVLVAEEYIGKLPQWVDLADVAEEIFPIAAFRGDLVGLLGTADHVVLRERDEMSSLEAALAAFRRADQELKRRWDMADGCEGPPPHLYHDRDDAAVELARVVDDLFASAEARADDD